MANAVPGIVEISPELRRRAKVRTITEPAYVRWLLIGLGLLFLGVVVLLPLGSVFAQALEKGLGEYLSKLWQEETRQAIGLTLLTAAIVVPLNTVFGVAAAWLVAKYRFPGKNLLITLIDLPFSVSPVISRAGVRAAVRGPGPAGRLAVRSRHQDHLRRAGHRAGHGVRDASRSWPARCCR